jgi:hypothetical protein
MYSGKPAASIVVGDVVAGMGLPDLGQARRLSPAGVQAVEAVAERLTRTVDALLARPSPLKGEALPSPQPGEQPVPVGFAGEGGEVLSDEPIRVVTCSCGSGIPVQIVDIDGQDVQFIALPYIFAKLRNAGKLPGDDTTDELMSLVEIYNEIPDSQQAAYTRAIVREYAAFCASANQTA